MKTCKMMTAMPKSITIRNVPDEARDELAARAALSEGSLQEYLRRELIETASKPDLESVLERLGRRRRAGGSSLPVSSILSYPDQDRRQ